MKEKKFKVENNEMKSNLPGQIQLSIGLYESLYPSIDNNSNFNIKNIKKWIIEQYKDKNLLDLFSIQINNKFIKRLLSMYNNIDNNSLLNISLYYDTKNNISSSNIFIPKAAKSTIEKRLGIIYPLYIYQLADQEIIDNIRIYGKDNSYLTFSFKFLSKNINYILDIFYKVSRGGFLSVPCLVINKLNKSSSTTNNKDNLNEWEWQQPLWFIKSKSAFTLASYLIAQFELKIWQLYFQFNRQYDPRILPHTGKHYPRSNYPSNSINNSVIYDMNLFWTKKINKEQKIYILQLLIHMLLNDHIKIFQLNIIMMIKNHFYIKKIHMVLLKNIIYIIIYHHYIKKILKKIK